MTILDRVGETRIRIDASQFADELAKRIPDELARHLPEDVDPVAWASATVGDLRRDLTKAGSDLNLDGRIDEMIQKIRQSVSTPALRTIIARLERELPDTDTDRYERAYTRGRVQARSIYLGLGLVAGVTAGVVAALLLDPKHGKERRDAIAGRTGSVTRDVSNRAKAVQEQVRGIAVERGVIKPDPAHAIEEATATIDETLTTAAEPVSGGAETVPSMVADPVAETRPADA